MLKDLEYVRGGHERQRLDLYLPEGKRPREGWPVIVWVAGGGWAAGEKEGCRAVPFVEKGYAVAAMNHRFSKDARFPAQIHDCKAAVRWLRAHAGEYGLNKDRFGVWGASSGGHLMALMGLTAGVKEFEGDGGNGQESSRVQAVVDWYGVTNFWTAGAKPTRTDLLGCDPTTNKEVAMWASPVTYVTADAAPFLIMHGEADDQVPIGQSEELAGLLEKAGVEVEMVRVPETGHGGGGFTGADVWGRMEKFLDRHLKG